MEHRVAEDRPRVVLEADEAGELEAFGRVDAQDDPVDERIEQEGREQADDRQEKGEVERALPAARPRSSRCERNPSAATILGHASGRLSAAVPPRRLRGGFVRLEVACP